MIIIELMGKISLVLLSLSLVIGSIVLPVRMANDRAMPFAYAQSTNAAMLTASAAATANSNVTSNSATTAGLQIKRDVNYFDSSSGSLVYPTSAATTTGMKLPAVIMVHEWWGINDNIRSMANTLAKQGYVVLAADLFKGQSAKEPNQAMQLVKIVSDNPEQAILNLQSAVKYLSSLPFVDSSKIASIGWCFGGGKSLQLALHSQQHPLVATILYYGTPLETDKQQLSNIKWPVLGIFGDKDQAIPLSNIQQFKAALDSIGIPNEIHIYKGLGHAFANPSGANYAPNETIDAWQKTLEFLKKYT
jgi:carboxymethylenebutenolidase